MSNFGIGFRDDCHIKKFHICLILVLIFEMFVILRNSTLSDFGILFCLCSSSFLCSFVFGRFCSGPPCIPLQVELLVAHGVDIAALQRNPPQSMATSSLGIDEVLEHFPP